MHLLGSTLITIGCGIGIIGSLVREDLWHRLPTTYWHALVIAACLIVAGFSLTPRNSKREASN